MQHKNKRAFSVRIPEIVIKDDLMFRTYSFYFCVHNLHTGGITLDYRKKTQQIADRLGISKNLVSYYIWECEKRGWMWRSAGNLHSLSQEKLKIGLGVKGGKGLKISIRSVNYRLVQKALRAHVIETNRDRQIYAVKQKEFNKVAKQLFGKFSGKELDRTQITTVRKQIKRFSAKDKRLLNNSSYEYTVSKRKVASLINRKCASTGSRYLKKATEFFECEKRSEVLETRFNPRMFYEYKKLEKNRGKFLIHTKAGNVIHIKCDLVKFLSLNKILT